MFFRRIGTALACLVPWLAAMFVFAFVLRGQYPLDGITSLSFALDGTTPWFEVFLPGTRASPPGRQEGGWIGQSITDDPVYARLRLPGAYTQADIAVEFRPHEQPLLEIGVERGEDASASYELVPLWSRELASLGWHHEEGLWLAPRTTLAEARTSEKLRRVSWHATGTQERALKDTGAVASETIKASLRGQHDFWIVPVEGKIALSLTLQDMNRSRTTAFAGLRLMRGETLVWSDAMSFGGKDDTKPSPLVKKELVFEDLAAGAYRLSVLADDSIFLREWTIQAKRWVIGPRVYFADEVGFSTSTPSVSVWTNSMHLETKTLHKEGLQTLTLGTASQELVKTHTTMTLSRDEQERETNVRFRAPKGNVWIVGDGYVSWREDALFLPQERRFTDDTRLEEEGVAVVASPYVPPEPLGDGWYRGRLVVPLDVTKDRLKLVLSAPGIKARATSVDVRRLEVRYTRPPVQVDIFDTVLEELRRAWRRW